MEVKIDEVSLGFRVIMGLYWGCIRIMEKRRETTMVYLMVLRFIDSALQEAVLERDCRYICLYTVNRFH